MANERENPPGLAPWEWLGLGILGVAVLYAIFKPSSAGAMTAPTTDTHERTTPTTPITQHADLPVVVTTGAPPMPPPNAGAEVPRPVASATLINRLQTSERARQVFAIQALFWSWGHYTWNFGYSNTLPDGVMTPGGPTEAKIREIHQLANEPVDTSFETPLILTATTVLGTFYPPNHNYLLPMKLPRAVIDHVNATIRSMSGSIALQAVPSD